MTVPKDAIEKKLSSSFFRELGRVYIPERKIDRSRVIQEMYDSISARTYVPGVPVLDLYYDKGHGVMRRVPILSELDYCIYYYCVVSLDSILAINRTSGTYGGWSMGNNAIKISENNDFSVASLYEGVSPTCHTFNRSAYIQQYGEFNTKILNVLYECNASKHKYSAVVKLDIANFYDNIRLDILEALIRGAATKDQSSTINLLFFFLKNWNKQLNTFLPQSVGLPQEFIGDCSRLLSNFYLQPYDEEIYEFCQKNKIKYLRYADDQLFFLPEKYDYRKLVCVASQLLSKIGLNINVSKVKYWNSIKVFSQERGYDMLSILDVGIAPSKQPKQKINDMAKKFLGCDRDQLEKRGSQLLKVIVSSGINRLNPQTRKEIVRIARVEYIDYLGEGQLKALKRDLRRSEWMVFAKALLESTNNCIGNSRKYDVYKFAKKNRVRTLYGLKSQLKS